MCHAHFVGNVVEFGNRCKTVQDYPIANLAFVCLLDTLAEEGLPEGVSFEYEHQTGDFPYYDLLVVVVGDARFCLPRPLIAVGIYNWFITKAKKVDRMQHGRIHQAPRDMSQEFKKFEFVIPEGWLLPQDADEGEWMTSEELRELHGPPTVELAEDELYAIQDSLSE